MSESKSYKELQDRWSNPKLLNEAAKRREHLDYDKINFGEMDSEKKYIISLLPQAHTAYYMGHYQSSISMCGSILEAMISKVLKDFVKIAPIEYNDGKYKIASIEDIEDLKTLSLNDYLKIFKDKKWLPLELYNKLQNIKEIRNISIHEKIPLFQKDKEKNVYFLELNRGYTRKIEINNEHVKDIAYPSHQITAWYVLKYTREILKPMIELNDS